MPKVLIIGNGAREHALAWAIARSPLASEVLCAPGNAGTGRIARNVPVAASDLPGLEQLALAEEVDLTVVGPELPLVLGLADRLRQQGLAVVGPDRLAARLEGSKAFAKQLMAEANVPTAPWQVHERFATARDHILRADRPLVVKADGLAGGKGSVVCSTPEQALAAAEAMLVHGLHGEAGRRVIVEERLSGSELSLIALTDGRTILPWPCCRDYKRLEEGDRGPNTGGMGAISPAPGCAGLTGRLVRTIMQPMLAALGVAGISYRGFLYAGLILTAQGPQVLEFNCRPGDPETQVQLMRLRGDLVPALLAAARGTLAPQLLSWDERPAACVVLAVGGYPGLAAGGERLDALTSWEDRGGVVVFLGATERLQGRLVARGGRVACVTARAESPSEARQLALDVAEQLAWPGARFRRDIGILHAASAPSELACSSGGG
ncbi:MAG: phosphoribosylamine--glycine ligase [Deltaproteobacteria bacterium]|nr:phosphoribosylamine--glycine ligase [Deltaproteobacteria bacterium]